MKVNPPIWTTAEIEYLTDAYTHGVPTSTIAKRLNRSIKAVHNRASKIGLRRRYHGPKKIALTEQQRAWLRRNYPHCRNKFLADFLGIGTVTLWKFATEMKLTKTREFMHLLNKKK
jgi:Mn-dependent DtxR family transcriptional regulator